MTFIPLSAANIQLMLTNDAQQLRTNITWLEQRVQAYNNLTQAAMTAAGITDTPTQNAILAFIADINRSYQYAIGNPQAIAADQRFDCAAILGVL
jgi:phage host-nuclease inhibitor protein Gam